MLLIEDLRVGSIVLRQGQPYELQRRDIGESKYINDTAIQLTPQILRNSGFCDTKAGFAFEGFRISPVVTREIGLHYLHHASDKPIKDVHELQLLFYALHNKEIRLKIEMPEFEIH
jgi:hypothetical protein